MSDEKLTRIERLLLYNQFTILQKLATDEDDVENYKDLCAVLQHGYELEYNKLFSSIWGEGISHEDCRFVMDVLDMFRVLQATHKTLADKSGIDPEDLRFSGFDGNNETDLMSYTEYLRDE